MEGCILTSAANIPAPSNSDYDIPWDTEEQFGIESFFNIGSPTDLDIPASLNGQHVEVFTAIGFSGNGATSMDGRWDIRLNGNSIHRMQLDNQLWCPIAMRSGIRDAVTADTYTHRFRTFGTTGGIQESVTYLGCIINPHEHILGAVFAAGLANQDISTGTVLDWATPTLDTLNTKISDTEFQAPFGTKAAVISVYGNTDNGGSTFSQWQIDKNGSLHRRAWFDNQSQPGRMGTFLCSAEAGDTFRVQADSNLGAANNTVATDMQMNIEWYG